MPGRPVRTLPTIFEDKVFPVPREVDGDSNGHQNVETDQFWHYVALNEFNHASGVSLDEANEGGDDHINEEQETSDCFA